MNEKKDVTREELFEIDIKQLLKKLWKRAWLIVLAGIIGAIFAFNYTVFFVPSSYQSFIKMFVNTSGVSVNGGTISIGNATSGSSLIPTYVEILKTRDTLTKIADEVNSKGDYEDKLTYDSIFAKIASSSVSNTAIFQITVTDSDPNRSKDIANTVAEILPYQISTVIDGTSVRTVELAVRGVKIAPDPSKKAIIGFFIGMLIIVAIIAITTIFDNYIHDEEYIIENYDIPLLAVIPDLRKKNGGRYGKYRYNKYGYRKYGGYNKNAYGYYRSQVNMDREDSEWGENENADK